MRRPIDTLAEGLGHPEGPDVLPDGRIVFVETYTSKVLAWSEELGIHDYVDCGGGPNACLVGRPASCTSPERRDGLAWRARSSPLADPEGLAGRAHRGGRRRGRRHPAASPERPDLRAGRTPVLHGSRRLPAERS